MAPIFEPTVTRIGETTMSLLPDGTPAIAKWMAPMSESAGENIIEFGGRSCYESYGRPSEATNTPAKYIKRTIHEQKHYSILEHAAVVYFIEGVSRSLTHELVRHRLLSYSQQSQRFVNVTGSNFVVPPAIIDADPNLLEALAISHEANTKIYDAIVNELNPTDERELRKESREAGRAVMPNMAETHIVVTGNLRSWLEFVNKRDIPGADAEIRRLTAIIHEDLRDYAPNVFAPLTESEQLAAA